jgi:hypothetical protein
VKLFVEREPVNLRHASGEVVCLDKSDDLTFLAPMMKDRNGFYSGFSSGVRGAILQKGDHWYRMKGCGCGQEGVLLQSHMNTPEPEGGQLQASADEELKVLSFVNQALHLKNIPNSASPFGRFDYKDYKLYDEQCSASVYKIKGDTRFDEFMFHLFEECLKEPKLFKDELVGSNIQSLLKNMGGYCATMMDTLYHEGVTWNIDGTGGTNAHVGNFVIHEDESPYKIRIGMVDFDGQTMDNITKIRSNHGRDKNISQNYDRTVDMEIATLRGSLLSSVLAATVSGMQKNLIPQPWLQAFDDGFVNTFKTLWSGVPVNPQPIDFDADRVFRRLVATSLCHRPTSYGSIIGLYNDALKDGDYLDCFRGSKGQKYNSFDINDIYNISYKDHDIKCGYNNKYKDDIINGKGFYNYLFNKI